MQDAQERELPLRRERGLQFVQACAALDLPYP
jgi:hypothetical protein